MINLSIKELRNNLAHIADRVSKGESFQVFRRSKLCFQIVPGDTKIDDQWETVVDFTDEGKREGENLEDVLQAFKTLKTAKN